MDIYHVVADGSGWKLHSQYSKGIREFILSVLKASGGWFSRQEPQGFEASFDETIHWRHQDLRVSA